MKQLEDLTVKELLEDLGYWIRQAQLQSPPFTDGVFTCIWESFKVIVKKLIED